MLGIGINVGKAVPVIAWLSQVLWSHALFAGEGPELYGVTADNSLVQIDTVTGQATFVRDIGLSGSLTYDPNNQAFGLLSSGSEPGVLTVFQLDGTILNESPVTGLPPGQEKTGGIGFSGTAGLYYVTFGQTGSNTELRVAAVDASGVVTEVSSDLGLGDNDGIVWDEANNRTLVHDFNASDGFPRLAEVTHIFTSPSYTTVANPPSNNDVGNTAVEPISGRIFIVSFDSGGGELIELVGDSYVTVGAFNVGSQVTGIAFVYDACAADLNGDGALDFFDVSAFLTAYNAMDPVADFNGDGSYDFFDVSAFLSAYNAGCP